MPKEKMKIRCLLNIGFFLFHPTLKSNKNFIILFYLQNTPKIFRGLLKNNIFLQGQPYKKKEALCPELDLNQSKRL
jgi:hypothetical protein